jgi:hypothetical protein
VYYAKSIQFGHKFHFGGSEKTERVPALILRNLPKDMFSENSQIRCKDNLALTSQLANLLVLLLPIRLYPKTKEVVAKMKLSKQIKQIFE